MIWKRIESEYSQESRGADNMLSIESIERLEKRTGAFPVPRLKELLAPCPICGGTTDIELGRTILCHSCKQEWTITGEPIMHQPELSYCQHDNLSWIDDY